MEFGLRSGWGEGGGFTSSMLASKKVKVNVAVVGTARVFRVQDLGYGVWGLGFRVVGLWFGVLVWGLGLRVWGWGFWV